MNRKQLLLEARSYLGTKYHHQGRLKGVGIDCVGVITGLAKFTNTKFQDITTYDPFGMSIKVEEEFRKYLKEVPLDQAKPGDVLTMWVRRPGEVVHCGILTDYGLLHTTATVGLVVEHLLDDRWKARLSCAFQYPGVTD